MRKTTPDNIEELMPHVTHSVDFYGTIVSSDESIEFLAQCIFENFNQGGGRNISATMRRNEDQLSVTTKKEYGITRANMNLSTWSLLNEEGRKAPLKSLEDVINAVSRGFLFLNLQEHIASGEISKRIFPKISLYTSRCCSAARAREGEIMEHEGFSNFPLAECDLPVCRCNYWLLTVDKLQNG